MNMDPKKLYNFWQELCGSATNPDIEIADLEHRIPEELPRPIRTEIEKLCSGNGSPDVDLGCIYDIIRDYVVENFEDLSLPEEARFILASLRLADQPRSEKELTTTYAVKGPVYEYDTRQANAEAAIQLLLELGVICKDSDGLTIIGKREK